MNTVKNLGIITVSIVFLVHLNQARNIQIDCLTLCAEGMDSLMCDCSFNNPFRFVKRQAKLPFRYGKRSFVAYPSSLDYMRNGLRSYDENPFLSKAMYDDY